MRNIDTETEEYGIETTKRTAKSNARRPVPDSEGPRARRAAPVADDAKHRTTQKRRKEPRYGIIDFFKDYRTHLGFGIFLCLTGLVMAICGVSFIFSNAADQSVIHGRSITQIVNSGDVVENAGGAAGAKLAEFMLVDTFGVGSFVLAYYLITISLAVMRVRPVRFWAFTFRCLFTTVAVSVIIGLLSFNRASLFHLGGAHGYYMNRLLMDYAGALGAYAVMVLMIGLLVAVYYYPLKQFFSMLGRVMQRKRAVADVTPEDIVDTDNTPSLDKLEADDSDAALCEATGISVEHLRFMPAAALDAFDDKDGSDTADDTDDASITDDSNDTVIATSAEVSENNTPAVVEPELIIVNKTPEEAAQEQEHRQIMHGDHIGLDQPFDPCASHQNYKFPSTTLLVERPNTVIINEEEQLANKKLIVDALRSYNIEIQRIEATIGPTVTLYEIVPQQGTRIAKIKSLEDDIAMTLSALGIRIIAPMPGKGTVGIEVPNKRPQIVSMRKVLESADFAKAKQKMALPMALGATISNDNYIIDLAKMPHLLVAGATGQGKSVGLNCIITSLLYSKHPDQLKFVLVDPKTVEFSLFENIGYQYLAKLPDEEKAVITDPQKVVATLYSLCVEMEKRYEMLSKARVKQISEYNEKFEQRRLNPQDGHEYMPYIVVIVDEYADLVMTAGKEVSVPIARITQKARAVGIHMILATQRPSTDVITGMIKNNFTARIAFKVTQSVDSKTILDRPGAQRLIGRGDMLTMINGVVERVQCAFVDTPEIEAICDHIGNQDGFVMCHLLPEPPTEEGGGEGGADFGNVTEEFKKCALFMATQTQASTSMLQRRFEIGFNKAGRFMDQMQQMGIVGPARGAKPRDVLMTPDEVQRLFE